MKSTINMLFEIENKLGEDIIDNIYELLVCIKNRDDVSANEWLYMIFMELGK